MEYPKKFHQTTITNDAVTITIEGPVTAEHLQQLTFHDDLKTFRPAHRQKEALVQIATLPEGRILVARIQSIVIGYVVYVYPDPMERWSKGKIPSLLELGAIEVSFDYRSLGIGKTLLSTSMLDEAMENYLIITTEYYWHWDLRRSGLSVWDYRRIMEKMMHAGGLYQIETNDPEIREHPANCLLIRIGKNVPEKDIEAFHQLRLSSTPL